MQLANQFKNLSRTQFKCLSLAVLDASIAYEGGGNYREIFRRAKLRRNGLMRQVFESLENAPQEEIECLSKSLNKTD
jgi:hypothetical protein